MSRLAVVAIVVAVLAAALVWIFRTSDARIVARFAPNDEYVKSAALSPDGKVLATSYSGTRLWDASTGEQIAYLPQVRGGDSKAIALLSDPCVGVGVAGLIPRARAEEPQVLTLFSCRGDALTTLKVIGEATGIVQEMTIVPACSLILVRFSTGVVVVDARSRSIRADLTKLFPKEAKAIAGSSLTCTAFVGVAESQQERFLLRIDLAKRQVVKLASIPVSTAFAFVSPLTLSADEKRLAAMLKKYTESSSPCDAIGSDCMVIFDTQSGVQLATHTTPGTSGAMPLGVEYIDDQHIALLVDATVFMLDLHSGESTPWTAASDIDEVWAIAYAKSAHRFAAAGKSEVRVIELTSR